MKYKSFILLIMIIILEILCIPATAQAVDASKIYLEAPKSGNRGDTITITVKTTGSSEGITGIQGKLNYDKKQLEYVNNKIIKSGWFVSGFNKDTGVFLLEVNDITDTGSFIHEDTEVVSFTFKIKDSAEADNTDITLTDIVASGASNLYSKETSASIAINGGNTSNSNSSSATINNLKADKNINASDTTTYKSEKKETKMPDTGKKSEILVISICILGICLISGVGYRRYKDI